MRKETQELGITIASQIRDILEGVTDPSLVSEFSQTRYESLNQTNSRVELRFPSGNKLVLWLDEKDAE